MRLRRTTMRAGSRSRRESEYPSPRPPSLQGKGRTPFCSPSPLRGGGGGRGVQTASQGGPRMAAKGLAASVVWIVSRELWESIEPILMKDGTPKAGTPPLSVVAGVEEQTVVVVEDPFYIVAPSPQADE